MKDGQPASMWVIAEYAFRLATLQSSDRNQARQRSVARKALTSGAAVNTMGMNTHRSFSK